MAAVPHTDSPTERGVSLQAAALAAAWCEYLELHARKVYSVELHPDRSAAKALVARIEAGAVEHGTTIRDLYRPQWSGLTTPEDVEGAIQVLGDCGWVRTVMEDTGGRPARILQLHPELRIGG